MKRGSSVDGRQAVGRRLRPLVGPVRETAAWKAVAACLDTIAIEHDAAVHQGFVRGNWILLDRKLNEIRTAANRARRIMRPNPSLQGAGHLVDRTLQNAVGSLNQEDGK